MADAAKYIDNYGRAPMRSAYNYNEDYKLRNCANLPWDLNNYNNLLTLLIWQLLTDFMLCGSLEVCSYQFVIIVFELTHSNFFSCFEANLSPSL